MSMMLFKKREMQRGPHKNKLSGTLTSDEVHCYLFPPFALQLMTVAYDYSCMYDAPPPPPPPPAPFPFSLSLSYYSFPLPVGVVGLPKEKEEEVP